MTIDPCYLAASAESDPAPASAATTSAPTEAPAPAPQESVFDQFFNNLLQNQQATLSLIAMSPALIAYIFPSASQALSRMAVMARRIGQVVAQARKDFELRNHRRVYKQAIRY